MTTNELKHKNIDFVEIVLNLMNYICFMANVMSKFI